MISLELLVAILLFHQNEVEKEELELRERENILLTLRS